MCKLLYIESTSDGSLTGVDDGGKGRREYPFYQWHVLLSTMCCENIVNDSPCFAGKRY